MSSGGDEACNAPRDDIPVATRFVNELPESACALWWAAAEPGEVDELMGTLVPGEALELESFVHHTFFFTLLPTATSAPDAAGACAGRHHRPRPSRCGCGARSIRYCCI